MNLYQGMNGDMSARIFVIAPTAKEARKLTNKKIKEDELQDVFPVLTLEKYKIEAGVIEVIQMNDLY